MKYISIILILTISCICFAISYFNIRVGESSNSKLDISITSIPVIDTLTWYTSIPLFQAERIANAFRTESSIDVKIVRNSTFLIRELLLSEIASGKTEADVITIADIGTFVELENKGILMEYMKLNCDEIIEECRFSSYWAIFEGFGICIAYNEDRISSPPKHWIDLLDKKWKGRIGFEDISTAGSQYGQYYFLRELLGVEFWRQLLSVQKPKIYKTTNELANALLTGEIDIAGEFTTYAVYDYRVKRGTPIQGVYPKEGIPFVLTPTAIINHTENPDKAKIFTDFLLSQKGQEYMQKLIFYYSFRKDVSALTGMPSLKELKILLPKKPIEYSEKRKEYIDEFNKFLEDKS